ncbi:BTB/POZ protein [Rhizophagus irregularis DAOM 181602=DAOM 197198]|nr:BTB/POZ protein [Rhizophagus irregularis DAOM 181602=DAOM 197198]
MLSQFFNKLSQNYIEILNDDEYYDVTIEVGKDPDVKIFRAHVIILCYRSPYFRRTLTLNKKNNDDDLVHIKLPNISPEIFKILLTYVYGDPDIWTDYDFKAMETTLQHCLPLIRFFSLSSEEFLQKVHPYKKLLKPQFYDELFKSYLNPNVEPSKDILLPRYRNIDGIIDSNIINLNISKNNFKDPILSHVKNTDCAVAYHNGHGPTFDTDLFLCARVSDGLKEYNFNRCKYWCKQRCYEKKIRDTEDQFLIEDYEVFQIIERDA